MFVFPCNEHEVEDCCVKLHMWVNIKMVRNIKFAKVTKRRIPHWLVFFLSEQVHQYSGNEGGRCTKCYLFLLLYSVLLQWQCCLCHILSWASIHKAVRRLTARSRKVSKQRDSGLNFSNRSEIWQVPRQRCCRGACQISERYDHCNIQSRGFETSRGVLPLSE